MLGAPLPDSRREFNQLVKNWFEEILLDRREAGHHEVWQEVKFDGETHIALAPVVGKQQPSLPPEDAKPPVAAVVSAPRPQPQEPEPLEVVAEDFSQFVRSILEAHEGPMPHKQLSERLLLKLENETQVREALGRMLQASELFRKRLKGSNWYSLQRFEKTTSNESAAQRKEDKKVLGERGKRIALAMLEVFGMPKMHANQRFTPKELLERIREAELVGHSFKLGVGDVRSVGRRLEERGILATGVRPANKGGHRSASRDVFKIGMASQEIRDQLSDPERRAELIRELLES